MSTYVLHVDTRIQQRFPSNAAAVCESAEGMKRLLAECITGIWGAGYLYQLQICAG